MRSSQELQRLIRDANAKLGDRQKDVEYWIREIQSLNRELMQVQRDEARRAEEEAKRFKKAA